MKLTDFASIKLKKLKGRHDRRLQLRLRENTGYDYISSETLLIDTRKFGPYFTGRKEIDSTFASRGSKNCKLIIQLSSEDEEEKFPPITLEETISLV